MEYEGPLDSWMRLLILKKYETLNNLYKYDIIDYLALVELALISAANEALSMAQLANKKK